MGHTLAVFELGNKPEVDEALADSFARAGQTRLRSCPLCLAPTHLHTVCGTTDFTAIAAQAQQCFSGVQFVGRMVLASAANSFGVLVAPAARCRGRGRSEDRLGERVVGNVVAVFQCAGRKLTARAWAVLLEQQAVVGGTEDGCVVVWDMRTAELVGLVRVCAAPVAAVAVADEDAALVLVCTAPGTVFVCSLARLLQRPT